MKSKKVEDKGIKAGHIRLSKRKEKKPTNVDENNLDLDSDTIKMFENLKITIPIKINDIDDSLKNINLKKEEFLKL